MNIIHGAIGIDLHHSRRGKQEINAVAHHGGSLSIDHQAPR